MIGENGEVSTSAAELWTAEYQCQGIPSSTRARPSNVVVDFVAAVRSAKPSAKIALDIGCGTGRNAVYLAEQGFSVKAMDYSAPQVEELRKFVQGHPALDLEAVAADVTKPWPWASSSADIAVDAFCFKHQIENAAIATYVEELRRCLVAGGRFMLFLATRADGYYRQFPATRQFGVGQIIVDPGNGIASRLYSREEVERLFKAFEVLHFAEKESLNVMHGAPYQRSSAVWHFCRR